MVALFLLGGCQDNPINYLSQGNVSTERALRDPTFAVAYLVIGGGEALGDKDFTIDMSFIRPDGSRPLTKDGYRPGETVLFSQNSRHLGVPPGDYQLNVISFLRDNQIYSQFPIMQWAQTGQFGKGQKQVSRIVLEPGEVAYLGHVVLVPSEQLGRHMSDDRYSQGPTFKLVVEDRFEAFAESQPPEVIARLRKKLIVLPENWSFVMPVRH